MKINILYDFKDGPYGGGNQFLKNLKAEFVRRDLYNENINGCDCVLVNSHYFLSKAIWFSLFRNKKIILRMDGFFHLHRGEQWKILDRFLINLAENIFDGIVFQSRWAFLEAKKLGFKKNIPYKIIFNSCDNSIFYPSKKILSWKIKLIATSWSTNWNKGFYLYRWLDDNLDFSKFDMVFVGNSPTKFKNIKMINAVNSENLGKILRKNDIYLSAVKNEACSNSILEALNCGLPVVAIDSGSNEEIVNNGGELFESEKDIIHKIDKVSQDLNYYKKNIRILSIEKTADYYIESFNHKKNKKNILWGIRFFSLLFIIKLKLGIK